MGQSAFAVGVLLPFGLAFQGRANRLQSRLIREVEDIVQWPAGGSVPIVNQLRYLNGRDQRRGREVFIRSVFGDAAGLDIETLGFLRPEQLLDGPAAAVIAGDPPRVRQTAGGVGRQQPNAADPRLHDH